MKRCGIYLWSLDGVPKYVGKSVDVHFRMMRSHRDSEALGRAIEKYGYDAFEKEVICYCRPDELNELEEHYIRKLGTHRTKGGYNLTFGGDGQGFGEAHPLYGVTGESHPSWGRKNSSETLKRMSEAHKGITHSDAAKKKLANANLGIKNPFFGKKPNNASSKYLGVSKTVRDKKYVYWQAAVTINGRTKRIGYFKTEMEAGQAYNDYVIEHKLPHPLNDI